MSGFSRIVHVLKTSTSASSCEDASPSPSDSSMPLIRSESWAFIWQPNVVTWYRFTARQSSPVPAARPGRQCSSARGISPSSIRVNSSGKRNFDAGLAPSALRVSRYWSVIVFSSTSLAASKMRVSASPKPWARRIAACLSPSARRIAACFSPSATVMFACLVPSASSTTARRTRSADIWRLIASWISRGGVSSRISTFVTLIPQRVVSWSRRVRMSSLIRSRCESTSSSGMSPITARRVVVASPITAAW